MGTLGRVGIVVSSVAGAALSAAWPAQSAGAALRQGIGRNGYVIYSMLDFGEDYEDHRGSNGSAWSGRGVFGYRFDLQLADDFMTTGHRQLTSVTAGYEAVLGHVPADGLQVDVWTATDSGPGELIASQTASVSEVTSWGETGWFGYTGMRFTANVDILLEPSTRYFIMIQPVDSTQSGDWYYHIRETRSLRLECMYARDGGRDDGGYGVTHWTSMEDLGFDRCDGKVEIRGVNPDCPGDCDGDGDADIADFTCFLNAWNYRNPAGDCDFDGLIDSRDLVCYLNLWMSGCP